MGEELYTKRLMIRKWIHYTHSTRVDIDLKKDNQFLIILHQVIISKFSQCQNLISMIADIWMKNISKIWERTTKTWMAVVDSKVLEEQKKLIKLELWEQQESLDHNWMTKIMFTMTSNKPSIKICQAHQALQNKRDNLSKDLINICSLKFLWITLKTPLEEYQTIIMLQGLILKKILEANSFH